MSTPNTEPIVEPVSATTPEQTVSTQIVEEPTVADTTTSVENTASPDTTGPAAKAEEEVSTEVVPSTEDTPAVATKSTEAKRRTIFNPFAKSLKKEENTAADEATTTTEEKPKKATKAFGTFFSRSKSSPKVTDEETAPASNAAVKESETAAANELPQIEQLQPIETDNIVATSNEDQGPTIKEAVTEVVESAEEQATEVAREVEQATTHLTAAVANKRQSFISKLFGGKNKKHEATKEVEENTTTATETAAVDTAVAAEEPAAETVEVEEQTGATTPEKVETHQRPSSPLGRLTELFSSKKSNKKAAAAAASATTAAPVASSTEEETPTVLVTEVEENAQDANANITEPVTSSTVAAPVVTASA